MSKITFHTAAGDLGVVPGQQRALAAKRVRDTALAALGIFTDYDVRSAVADQRIPHAAIVGAEELGWTPLHSVSIWIGDYMGTDNVEVDGELTSITQLSLNTAAVWGSDAVAFSSRLHGSVEHLVWVDGADAVWFAGVLRDTAEETGEPSWADIADKINEHTGPIVISTSVGEEFPLRTWTDEDGETVFTWAESLAKVQADGWWLQITPKNLHEPAYGKLATFPAAKNPDTYPRARPAETRPEESLPSKAHSVLDLHVPADHERQTPTMLQNVWQLNGHTAFREALRDLIDPPAVPAGVMAAIEQVHASFTQLAEARNTLEQDEALIELSNRVADLISFHPAFDIETGTIAQQET